MSAATEQRRANSSGGERKANGPRSAVLGSSNGVAGKIDISRPGCKGETVARGSGLAATCGTFGKSERFSAKVRGPGQDSASDKEYYGRNRLWKAVDEEGRHTALGFGHRPPPGAECGSAWAFKDVGPGSYEVCTSVAKSRSPLDGSDFCSTTMAKKLVPGSCIGGSTAASPGPHARYQVAKDLVLRRPKYRLPLLGGHINVETSKNKMKEIPQDNDDVGPGHYFQGHTSIAVRAQSQVTTNTPDWHKSKSAPNLHSSTSSSHSISEHTLDWSTGGTKQFIKGTFGQSKRFPPSTQTNSPKEHLYYAHVKLLNQDDYMAGARSCSLGSGMKTDFTNPTRTHRNEVSPATYAVDIGHSATKATSPIDGFTQRNPSPVRAFGGNLHKPQARKTPNAGNPLSSQGGGSREDDRRVTLAEGAAPQPTAAAPAAAPTAAPAAAEQPAAAA